MNGTTVAIIGGGFSGTVAAIRLLTATRNGSPSLPFGSRVVLVEPGRAGEGLAYRAGPDAWRLNVPADRMSAFPERPGDFLEWAQARNPLVSGGDFLPRAWYGDYLAERLDLARRRSPRWLSFQQVRARATGIDVAQGSARIALTNGETLEADRVLLALGNSPTAGSLRNAPHVVDDAWNLRWMDRLPTYVPRVLLVGTGLTMIDQVLAIAQRRPDARVMAISRHGLLPLAHEDEKPRPAAKFDAAALLARGPLSQRLHLFRAQVEAAGGDWRGALQQVREVMPALWRAAPRRLRRRFLRHLRAYWDVHRHRVPRETLQRIDSLREKKRLEVLAGRIIGTRSIQRGVVVTWQPRGSDKLVEELVDVVVNVTGPGWQPAALGLLPGAVARGTGPLRARRPRARLGHGPGRAPVRRQRRSFEGPLLRRPAAARAPLGSNRRARTARARAAHHGGHRRVPRQQRRLLYPPHRHAPLPPRARPLLKGTVTFKGDCPL